MQNTNHSHAGPAKNRVLVVPVLPCERWTSIDLYRENLKLTLSDTSSHRIDWIEPNWSPNAQGWRRRYLRYFKLPARLNRQFSSRRQTGPFPLVHILDHSYGHLIREDVKTVVTCNDVDHFIVSGIPPLARLFWKVKVRRLQKAWRIIAITSTLKEQIIKFIEVEEDRIVVNPYGIDHSVFRPAMPEGIVHLPANVLAAKSKGTLVAHIGKLGPRKNLNTLLKAIGLLRQRGFSLSLVRIGESIFSNELTSTIRQWNLADAIIDLGMRTPSEIADILSACDVLAFPSVQEGFGRPTLEAQACGIPCVLSDLPVMREVSGGAALFHESFSEEQLASHLQRVLEDTELRKSLILRGLANAKSYSWETHASKLHQVYSTAVELN